MACVTHKRHSYGYLPLVQTVLSHDGHTYSAHDTVKDMASIEGIVHFLSPHSVSTDSSYNVPRGGGRTHLLHALVV